MEEHRKAAGQRARDLRIARGWTHEDVAHASGLSVKTVARFERGRHDARAGTVRALARAFDVSEREITGPPPAPLGLGASLASNGAASHGLEELSRELGQLRGVVDEIMRLARDQSDAIQDLRRLADAFQAAQDARETREPPEEDSGT